LTQHHELIKHPGVFVKVKHLGELLKAKLCIARLVEIQGHTGIAGNEHADLEAKMVAMSIVNGKMDAPTNTAIADAYKMSADIAQTSWQRRWDCDSKGRYTYELIPEVSTKILWPRKREVGVAYCRILLHDTMLNADAFRTGVAESSICACGTDNETVEHVLFRCAIHDDCRTQLIDVLNDIWISATANSFVHSKAHMLISPNSSGFVTKHENCTLKEVLFQFLATIDRRM